MTIFQSSYHRLLVDDLPPSGVDDNPTRFHQPDPIFTNETNRFWSERHVDAQDIRLPQHVLYALEILAVLGRVAILLPRMVNDPHWECVRENGETHPDTTQAEDTERLSSDIVSFRADSFRFPM
jgi:hypothetical protein